MTSPRRGPDRGPAWEPDRPGPDPRGADALGPVPARVAFERTVGDEFQGVLDQRRSRWPTRVERLLRADAWNIGVGIGVVEEPLPDHTRAGRGPAYLHARTAVTAAKNSPWHTRVVGDDPAARALETTIWLWAAVLARRTPRGWEVADLVAEGLSYGEVGERLGISQSAVSQRAQAAGIVEGRRAHELVVGLTTHLLGKEVAMTPDNWGALALVLLGFAVATSLLAWTIAGRRIWAPATLVAARRRGPRRGRPRAGRGRGPRRDDGAGRPGGRARGLRRRARDRARLRPRRPARAAGGLARRGPGRCCAGAPGSARSSGSRSSRTLVAGWPEGLALVLALKGLGPLPRAPRGRDRRRAERHRRAVHHRHVHERALGLLLRRCRRTSAALTRAAWNPRRRGDPCGPAHQRRRPSRRGGVGGGSHRRGRRWRR